MLVVGTVASLACALGPAWVVRLGLVPALGAALVSCLLAWREIDLERRAHAAAMLSASRRHGEQLTEERRHNAAVVDALGRRIQSSVTVATSRAATIARLNGELGRLHGDVDGLRGANSRLTRDLNFRDLTIRELRATVADREAELRSVRAIGEQPEHAEPAAVTATEPTGQPEDTGEIHAFPRRPLRDEPGAEGRDRRTADFDAANAVVSLPNYEDDRRFA